MIQRRGSPRFLLEPAQALWIGAYRLRQHLDRNFAIQSGVKRAVNFAHSTRTQG
jgi:hypothetical protein